MAEALDPSPSISPIRAAQDDGGGLHISAAKQYIVTFNGKPMVTLVLGCPEETIKRYVVAYCEHLAEALNAKLAESGSELAGRATAADVLPSVAVYGIPCIDPDAVVVERERKGKIIVPSQMSIALPPKVGDRKITN